MTLFKYFVFAVCIWSTGARAQDANQWVVISAVKYKQNDRDLIKLWTSRGADRTATTKAAMKGCTDEGFSNCVVMSNFHEGCGYFAIGSNIMGQSGGGFGLTPQAAYDKCYYGKKLNCMRRVSGGCANPNDDLPLDATTVMPSHRYWIAFAFKIQTAVGAQGVPAAGLGVDLDREEAKRKAIKRCEEEGDKYNATFSCDFLNDYNSGCQYGSIAVSADKGGTLFTASTAEGALKRCSDEGYQCDKEHTFGTCEQVIPASKF